MISGQRRTKTLWNSFKFVTWTCLYIFSPLLQYRAMMNLYNSTILNSLNEGIQGETVKKISRILRCQSISVSFYHDVQQN